MGSKPSTPNYNQTAALNEQQRLNQAAGYQQYANVNSPLGGYSTSVDPKTGQITIDKNLSPQSQMALAAQHSALSNYTGDPTDAANQFYQGQMAYLQPQFDRQIQRGESSLTNRGLPIGSGAWNEAMGDIYNRQNQELSALAANSLFQGQQFQGNILNQAQMAGNQVIDPALIAGQSAAGMSDTYQAQLAQQNARAQEQAQRQNAIWGALGSVGGGVTGAVTGNLLK